MTSVSKKNKNTLERFDFLPKILSFDYLFNIFIQIWKIICTL